MWLRSHPILKTLRANHFNARSILFFMLNIKYKIHSRLLHSLIYTHDPKIRMTCFWHQQNNSICNNKIHIINNIHNSTSSSTSSNSRERRDSRIMKPFLLVLTSLIASTSAFTTVPAFLGTKQQQQQQQQQQRTHTAAAPLKAFDYALIFDCDGVIIETEELHRLAYNAAFDAAGLTIDGQKVHWSVEYYDILQNTVGGGKGKMFYHFRNTTRQFPSSSSSSSTSNTAPPTTPEQQQALVDALQAHKTELYKNLIAEKAVPRPGVIELMDQAIADPNMAVGVCSASTKEAVTKVLDVTLGEDRRKKLDVCILGDDVSKLKPDPMIYNTAAQRLGIDPNRCVVVEDSMVGLRAAKGAGMKCIITYTKSTEAEDFYGEGGADAKVPELAARGVTLQSIFGPLQQNGIDAELLVGIKD